MGAEGKLPARQRKRKRSPAGPEDPGSGTRAKREPGEAAAALPNTGTTAILTLGKWDGRQETGLAAAA